MTSSQVAIGPATEINNVDGTGQAFPNETPGGVISGATITFADSQAHSITLGDNSIAAVYGGAGLLTVTAVAAGITAVGGSGGMAYTEQPPSSGNSIATAAGSSNVLTLSGSDVIDSDGTDTITTAGPLSGTIRGNAVITSSGGGVSLVLTGIDVFSGQGNDTLAVAAGAVATVTDSGFASVTETGARVSFTGQTSGPSATVTVTGGGALIHSDAAGGLSVTTAAGQSTVVQMGAGQQSVTSASDDRIYGGTGTDTIDTMASGVSVWCESGAVTVIDGDAASNGATTVYGGAGSLSLGGGVDALTFIGGSGSAVITGGSGAVHVSAGSGALTLSSGSGPTTFIGSSGSANLSLGVAGGAVQFGIGATTVNEAGSGSADIYTLVATRVGASDVINGFRVGTDKLVLNGVSVLGETLSGGSGGIAFSDHIQLTLTGVTDLAAVFG
jgi:Ca2+-binding RTX toxin-like protein